MSERLTIAELRKKYPHPKRNTDPSVGAIDCYCVAGALCFEMDHEAKLFPDAYELKKAVQQATQLEVYPPAMPDKEYERFMSTCEKVIALNDIGKFEQAWRALEKLLTWKYTELDCDRR